jgi:SAM-dependent methyltransferase
MTTDIRNSAAKYYDCEPGDFGDLPFYKEQAAVKRGSVLELGCGTGRILIPLSREVSFIHGIDSSGAMLALCRRKMAQHGISRTRAAVDIGDITHFELDRDFDLIIAPYRVIQNLETDLELSGLFRSIRRHLKDDGTCILNVFNPNAPWPKIEEEWSEKSETFEWEVPFEGGTLSRTCRKSKLDKKNRTLYPDLIYRIQKDGKLVEETVLSFAMRCFYPDEFKNLIEEQDFSIIHEWGGYKNEPYGQGPELILEFSMGD